MPVVRGIIERRILVNYRVEPDVIAAVLPAPFRPKLQRGSAIAGICLIRLSGIRPPLVPAALGVSSENAAHRIAVEWDEAGIAREGVFIPRRDTSSRLNTVLGGRLFPGVHHHARFDVGETGAQYRLQMDSDDGVAHVRVEGTAATELPAGSVFGSLEAASMFFERGSLGYSATHKRGVFDGLELRSLGWKVEPLDVSAVGSSFFEDPRSFPPGAAEFDCALLMRDVAHEWRARDQLCVEPRRVRAS
jgi:Uncharacterized conserved protein (COG2071)